MNKRFFPKKDEIILSAFMVIIVGGLIYQGIFSLCHMTNHKIFYNNSAPRIK